MPEYLSKQGVITKQGHLFKTWKRRWAVLEQHTLSYYAAADAKLEKRLVAGGPAAVEAAAFALRSGALQLKGQVPLLYCNVTEQAGFKFEVHCRTAAADEGGKPLKRFLIGVADAQERDEWVGVIRNNANIGRNGKSAAPSATASASATHAAAAAAANGGSTAAAAAAATRRRAPPVERRGDDARAASAASP